ncbi:ABC transporter substrate-binding protein [Nitriliruptoraceae bacterium ZYF776]|nr:ABC transporter substrate-binding protein [Profundirhabdus halotolerans]
MRIGTRRRGPARTAATLATAALLLSACGGMDGSTEEAMSGEQDGADADEPPADGEEGAADCEQIDEVTVVLQWVTQAQFAGYYAAEDQGFYDAVCLDVTIQEGGVNVVPQQLLASGNVEFAVSHVTRSMVTRDEGADIVNIGQVFQEGAYLQVAWADAGISDLEDLAGRTIGSWGSGNELVLYSALRGSGIEPGQDVDVVQQPFDMSLLLDGEVDAAQAKTYNEYAQLLETIDPDTGELYTEDDFVAINLQDLGYSSLEDGIYAQSSWLEDEANADVAVRFLEASYEGWIHCRDDLDSCVDTVLANGSALGASHQEWMMNEVNQLMWPYEPGIGTMRPEAFDQTIDIAIEGEVLADAPEGEPYRTDLTEQALDNLRERGVDVVGADYEPVTVELQPGGE